MKKAKIHYFSLTDEMRKEEKLQWFSENRLENISFEIIRPDKNANWINLSNNDFETLIPLIDKDVKAGKKEEAIFKLYSLGVASHRDAWVYDFSNTHLENKMRYFIEVYQNTLENPNYEKKNTIAWDRELAKYLDRKIEKSFDSNSMKAAVFRPFTKKYHYFDKHLNGMLYQWNNIYNSEKENKIINFRGVGMDDKPFSLLVTNSVFDLQTLPNGQCLPLYRYDSEGNQVENITDWALQQFTDNYTDDSITKEDIFHYVYSVLHNPIYREKYETNLKREFPRIPFYTDFHKWVAWGKKLMDLHINYESVEPYPLVEKTIEKETPKAKLKAIKETGEIVLDESTSLLKVPIEVYEYKLGNRSAVEWILDQYKESKPTDPTIAEKFNTYKFADYKTEVIELLKRVCTVSIETMEIISEMNT